MTSKTTNKFSPEVRTRAVRMVLDHEGEHASRWAAVVSIAAKIGCTPQTLNEWVKKAEVDSGKRSRRDDGHGRQAEGAGAREPGASAGERDPAQGVGVFCPGGARPPVQAMIAFIDDHREAHGVEPICKVLADRPVDLSRPCRQARRSGEAVGASEAGCGPEAGDRAASSRRTSRSMACARSGGSCSARGFDVARCTVARLMRGMGLQGVIRGKPVRTTISDKAAPCPLDHVNRQFQAPRPNALWVSDFTYVATWAGFVYVAFVIDAYARRIVGWRVSRTAHAELRARCAGAGPA